MYGILESYIMRRVVVHASTKSYNNLFTSLILNKVLDSQTLTLRLKGIGDATTYCPDDNEMKNLKTKTLSKKNFFFKKKTFKQFSIGLI